MLAFLIPTVAAYESSISISVQEADYPESVEAGGVLDLEVTVDYNFTQAARLNVWVLDGPWFSYSTDLVAEVYVDVNEPGPKVVSLQVPVPDEVGEYVYEADAGWCELDSTDLLPSIDGYQRYNITFTVIPVETIGSEGTDTTTGGDSSDTGGIPGYPIASLLGGLILVIYFITRKNTLQFSQFSLL